LGGRLYSGVWVPTDQKSPSGLGVLKVRGGKGKLRGWGGKQSIETGKAGVEIAGLNSGGVFDLSLNGPRRK